MNYIRTLRSLKSVITRLRALQADRSGLALTEFAIAFPIFLTFTLYGIELSRYAMTHLRLSQIALNLADHASRVGNNSSLTLQQMREVDANEVLEGARMQGQSLNLATNGRIILSSLENQSGTQMIHWQRCLGLKSSTGYNSNYGTTTATDGTDSTAANDGTPAPSGMGPTGAMVTAPTGTIIMFVEVNYEYVPTFGFLWPQSKIQYIGSFFVRDQRDFTQIYNPSPTATRKTCNLYSST